MEAKRSELTKQDNFVPATIADAHRGRKRGKKHGKKALTADEAAYEYLRQMGISPPDEMGEEEPGVTTEAAPESLPPPAASDAPLSARQKRMFEALKSKEDPPMTSEAAPLEQPTIETEGTSHDLQSQLAGFAALGQD